MKSNRAEWAEHLKQWKKSGLTADEFSAKIGINANTFKNRTWRLGRDRRSLGSGGFVEIIVPRKTESAQQNDEKEVSHKSEPVELVLSSGHHILVPIRFDAACLRRLIDTLEGR
jgi:hypothetical protein